MRYKRKPAIVDAFLFTVDVDMVAPKWFQDDVQKDLIFIDRAITDGAVKVYGCTLYTPHGRIKAKIGDYIVREPTGEITICDAKRFKEMYERMRNDGS